MKYFIRRKLLKASFSRLQYHSLPTYNSTSYLLQALACASLGKWYQEIGKDLPKAKNCYEETLLIDPQAEEVAAALKTVNEQLGLNVFTAQTATLSLLSAEKPASAFAAQSQKSFESLSPRGNHYLLACSLASAI